LLGVFSLVGKVDGERVVRQCRSRGFELVINLKTAKSLDPELAPMLFVRPRGDRKTSADPDCHPGRLSVEVRCGSIASLWQRARHFRSTLNSGHAAAPR
jgi:hypothetical protein